MALTQEERSERNRARCRRYYQLNKEEGMKRRVLNAIKRKGHFPRNTSSVTSLELVECFTEYIQAHIPSEFALRKYRALLASK
jgi:hypothetical protein